MSIIQGHVFCPRSVGEGINHQMIRRVEIDEWCWENPPVSIVSGTLVRERLRQRYDAEACRRVGIQGMAKHSERGMQKPTPSTHWSSLVDQSPFDFETR